jgi:hypothetical protein
VEGIGIDAISTQDSRCDRGPSLDRGGLRLSSECYSTSRSQGTVVDYDPSNRHHSTPHHVTASRPGNCASDDATATTPHHVTASRNATACSRPGGFASDDTTPSAAVGHPPGQRG